MVAGICLNSAYRPFARQAILDRRLSLHFLSLILQNHLHRLHLHECRMEVEHKLFEDSRPQYFVVLGQAPEMRKALQVLGLRTCVRQVRVLFKTA